MAKRLKLEEKVALIRELGKQEITTDSVVSLLETLNQKSNILVRTAAKVIEKCEVRDCIPEMQVAFLRF
jgi:endonuclease V-like protein UPF0215 family